MTLSVAQLTLEINISIFLGFIDLNHFGFTEECINVTVVMVFSYNLSYKKYRAYNQKFRVHKKREKEFC